MVETVHADDVMVGTLKLTAAWARATPKGATVGGGYFTITNTGSAADRLIGGASNVSNRFEIHEMSMDKGVMKMREIVAAGGLTGDMSGLAAKAWFTAATARRVEPKRSHGA